jgi:hypothetical protein
VGQGGGWSVDASTECLNRKIFGHDVIFPTLLTVLANTLKLISTCENQIFNLPASGRILGEQRELFAVDCIS